MTQLRFGVSLVIPCRNRPERLADCLAAVARLDPAPLEIIVVDSHSRDPETLWEISAKYGAHFIRMNRAGASAARNAGINRAQGDIVAFLDNDALPDTKWLAHLVAPFANALVGCVVGRTEPDFGATQDRHAYQLLGYTRRTECVTDITPDQPNWQELACFGGIGIAPNLAIRRLLCSENQAFCERLGPGTAIHGNEEGYLFLQILRRGYSITYVPEALVFHPVPAPPASVLRARFCENLTAATAFVLKLIVEERGCRWMATRYLGRKLWPVSRLWQRQPASCQPSLVPSWRVLLARASGVICYVRSLGELFCSRAQPEAEYPAYDSVPAYSQEYPH